LSTTRGTIQNGKQEVPLIQPVTDKRNINTVSNL